MQPAIVARGSVGGPWFTLPTDNWRHRDFQRLCDLLAVGGCFLYRMRSPTSLLYVGISRTPADRWSTHRRKKIWWPDVEKIEYELWPSEYAALCAENHAIRTEWPTYNIRVAAA